MNENKHQFCVGDLVNLKPIMLRYQTLRWAYENNPHRVIKVERDGSVQIDALGTENTVFHPRCFDLVEPASTPIDDLI